MRRVVLNTKDRHRIITDGVLEPLEYLKLILLYLSTIDSFLILL
jgi:hypothetical protein